jgi:hypothetical protein
MKRLTILGTLAVGAAAFTPVAMAQQGQHMAFKLCADLHSD